MRLPLFGDWINIDEMVLARRAPRAGEGGGNLPVYTAITVSLLPEPPSQIWFERVSKAHQITPGNFVRDPRNSQKQETWDNYLGWLNMCVNTGDVNTPRAILKHAIKNLGRFDTDNKPDRDDYLVRSLHVFFALLIPCAYRPMRWPFLPVMWLFGKFLNADHPGGVMLDFLYFDTCRRLGFKFKQYDEVLKKLPDALRNQLDFDHPAISMAEDLVKNL